MYNKTRLFFISLTVIAVLLFSAVGPTPVYADDGTTTGQPTDEAASGADPQPGEESGELAATSEPVAPAEPGEPAVPVEPAAINEPVVTSEPAASVEPAATSEPVIDSTLLEQVPDNTTIIVINSVGETQPLAAQETAEAIALSDPIWCPEGQSPTPGNNGCTSSFSSFNALLTHIQANEATADYQQAGTIYVQMGAYYGGESSIDFNSFGFSTFNTYNLNIQGGWDTSGDTVNPAVGTAFNTPMVIGTNVNTWAGSLTFNNLQFGNISNNTALTVYSQNNITLSDVEITNINNGNAATLASTNGDVTISGGQFNNGDIGAEINAGGNVTINNNAGFENNKKAGAVITAGGNVTISDATFNNNGSSNSSTGKGLEVKNQGDVSLYNVEANNNNQFGANILSNGNVAIAGSFFSGNQSYTYSCQHGTVYGGYGLQIVSTKAIALFDVHANNDYLFGASLTGSDVSIGSSTFSNNGSTKSATGKGLIVNSSASVSLSSVEANNNQLFGANIQATDGVAVSSSFFSGNKAYTSSCGGGSYTNGYGLQVVTTGGVSLDGVTANDNFLFGASLTGSDVSVSNGTFSNNGSGSSKNATGKGLIVNSSASVSLSSVEANNNQLFGANIQATDGVAVSSSFFSGNKAYTSSCGGGSYTNGYGLQVVTTGGVSLDGVTANDNSLFGASLTGSDVSVSNSTFSNNSSGSSKNAIGKGLIVNSSAAVSLSSVEANNNQLFGANIQAIDGVSISSSFFSGNTAYTSSCGGGSYSGYGLQVVTTGMVALSEVTASDNGSTGAILNTKSDVVVSDSTFDHNKGTGLSVTTPSHVTLTNVVATNNGLNGVDIIGSCTTTVDVVGGTYSNNSKYGIKAVSATVALSGSPAFVNNPAGNLFVDSSNCSSSGGGNGNSGGSHDDHHDDWDHKGSCGGNKRR